MRSRFFAQLLAVMLALAAPIAGSQSHIASEQQERFIEVDGSLLRIVEMALVNPVVVFISGLGEDAGTWRKVQPQIAKFARTVSYDRAGLGRSMPTDQPRDVESLAAELHKLLSAARIARPLVLVGHSLGGTIASVYSIKYSEDVAGLVLVDPEDSRLLDVLRTRMAATDWENRQSALAKALPNMPPAVRAEQIAFEGSGAIVARTGLPRQVPTILLTGTKKNAAFPGNPLEQDLKLEIHRADIAKVNGGRHVLVPESRHYIQSDAPEAVIEAVKDIVNTAATGYR
jgi:pimeloyl-ACP methyl ester carboxylesterase